MILSKIAILALNGCGPDVKKELADALGVSEVTIYRYIRDNNDDLTKAGAMEIIRRVTGLPDDLLLEREPERMGDQN